MAPAVAPAPQVWRASAGIRVQGGRHFSDAPASEGRLHYHLACELHPRRARAEGEQRLPVEAAQPAVEVAHRRAEEKAPDETQHRIAEVAMQRRHRAPEDAALEAIAHHERIALPQLVDEAIERREIVAVIGIAHDHETAACCGDACGERCAIAALRHFDDARASTRGERARVVVRSVVGDKHLAVDAGAAQKGARFLDTATHGRGLVQATHENRELHPGPGGRYTPKKRYPEGYLFRKAKLVG